VSALKTVQTESGGLRPVRGVVSTLNGTTSQGSGGLHQCPVPGCYWSYKTPGWLTSHIKSSHGLEVQTTQLQLCEHCHFGWLDLKCELSACPCVVLPPIS
jgi:hypothetical protein